MLVEHLRSFVCMVCEPGSHEWLTLLPRIRKTEHTMRVIPRLERVAQDGGGVIEGAPQEFGGIRAAQNLGTVQVNVRLRRWVAGDLGWMAEVVFIMTSCTAAYCERCGQAVAPSAGSANSLLIVEPGRRHICEQDGAKRADVYAGFHRRRDGQDVDPVNLGLFVIEEHVLELRLARNGIEQIGLSRELFGMESKRFSAPQREP